MIQKTLLQKNHNRIPKQNQPYMYKITYLACKNFSVEKILGLSGLGGRINLETFQKFEGKEEKNQDQT